MFDEVSSASGRPAFIVDYVGSAREIERGLRGGILGGLLLFPTVTRGWPANVGVEVFPVGFRGATGIPG